MASIDPLNLFDTYKQYKPGANKVTTWLVSKAREAGFLSDMFSDVSEVNSKGKCRLKGKPRAAQKASEKRNGQTYQIPLTAIPRIAKAIAGMKNQEVPGTIIRTLEEVIAARSACIASKAGRIYPRKHQIRSINIYLEFFMRRLNS